MRLTRVEIVKLSEALRTILTICPPVKGWDEPHSSINYGPTRHTDELIREIIRQILHGTIGSYEDITVCGTNFKIPDENLMKLGNTLSEWAHYTFYGDGG